VTDWISVSDKKPPHYEEVLVSVYAGYGVPFVTAMAYDPEQGWYTFWENRKKDFRKNITHWAELPNAFNPALTESEAENV
jgi:uncharacterized protein DUF551